MFNVSLLEVAHLTYTRNQRLLFRDLSFQACQGELIQVEGANGAGKTTLFRLLAGLAAPESGQILWCSVAIKKQWDTYQQQLIYLGHLSGNKGVLTVFENLAFYQSLQGDMHEAQIWQALEQVDLLGYEDVPVMQLSAGQQRRVALARLWLNSATLWILDEPLTAIDQHGVSRLLELFEQHQQRGGIILLTTHQDFDYTRRKLRLGGKA